jgi:hypothetical protein
MDNHSVAAVVLLAIDRAMPRAPIDLFDLGGDHVAV